MKAGCHRLFCVSLSLLLCAAELNGQQTRKLFHAQIEQDSLVLLDNVHEVAVTPDGNELWAYGCHSSHIAVVDIRENANRVITTIKIPGFHRAPISNIIFSRDNRYAFLTNCLQETYMTDGVGQDYGEMIHLLIIDRANSYSVTTIPFPQPFWLIGSLAVTADGSTLYLTCFDNKDEYICRVNLISRSITDYHSVPGINCLALSPDGKYIYCTRGWDIHRTSPDLFSIVDRESFQILSSVNVGRKPQFLAVAPNGSKVYVSNQLSNDVSVVDLYTKKVKATIKTGPNPDEIVFTPDGARAFVGVPAVLGTMESYNVDVPFIGIVMIDATKDSVKALMPMYNEPAHLAMHPDGSRVYVSDGNANGRHASEAHILNANTGAYMGAITLRPAAVQTPTGIEATPDGSRIFVMCEGTKKLLTIDTWTQTMVSSLEISPRAMKLSRDGRSLYVYCPFYPPSRTAKLVIFDAKSMAVLKSVDIGNAKMNDTWDSVVDRICLDSGEQTAYVTSGDNIELIAVDLVGLRVMARVPLVSGRTFSVPARGLAMTPDDRQIFVTAGGTNRIYVIDTHLNRIVDSVQVDNCPSELVMSQDGKKLYVLQQHTSNAITVVDAVTHKVVRGVNVLNGIAASVDFELFPDERTAYILCFDPNCLLVYDLEETDIHKARKSVTVSGLDPFNVAASSQKRYLFITNFSSDYVTIFDTQLNAVVSTIQLNNSITGLQSASIVKNFDLSQNYPNPFNPSTAIQYSLATEGHVSLRLYDVLGRLMMVLKDGCEQAGKHTVTVDASRLSSGVYFYQLQAVDASAGSARSFVETKKMVLIR